MVSKLDILSRYYQIYLDDMGDAYFVYENKLYFLSDRILTNEEVTQYQTYLYHMKMQGYLIIRNCFGHTESEGYMLYGYEPEAYSLSTVFQQSFQVITGEYASLSKIKSSWCRIIDDARSAVAKYASRINHNEYYVILSYYYQGLAENIICVINETLLRFTDERLPLGYEHATFEDSYDVLFNPTNFIISTRVRDIAMAYQQQCITIEVLEQWIQMNILSELEIVYLYIRVLFPSHFFSLVLNRDISKDTLKQKMIVYYQQIDNEKQRFRDLYQCLSKYTYIPPIYWLMSNS